MVRRDVQSHPLKIYICYDEKDKPFRDALAQHLGALAKKNQVTVWDESQIQAGQDRQKQIDHAISNCGKAILLVSVQFFNNHDIMTNILARLYDRFIEEDLPILPILVRPFHWEHSELKDFTPLPKSQKSIIEHDEKNGDRDKVWMEIVSSIIKSNLARKGLPSKWHSYFASDAEELFQELDKAYQTRDELVRCGKETGAIDEKISKIKHELRKGEDIGPGVTFHNGRFELKEIVGFGGFATVWRAFDRVEERNVALKILHGQYARVKSRRERFFRGARKMHDLKHPHIAAIVTPKGSKRGCAFFVMEYAEYGDFSQYILKQDEVDVGKIIYVIVCVGMALHFAHQKGIVHRDVKPANILMARDGPRLSDFDLVQAKDTTGGSRTGALGSFLFSPPEALEDADATTPVCDVYGLAMTTVFALSRGKLSHRVLRDPDSVLGELPCDNDIRSTLAKGISFDAGDRFSTTKAFCESLCASRRKVRLWFPRDRIGEVVKCGIHNACMTLNRKNRSSRGA